MPQWDAVQLHVQARLQTLRAARLHAPRGGAVAWLVCSDHASEHVVCVVLVPNEESKAQRKAMVHVRRAPLPQKNRGREPRKFGNGAGGRIEWTCVYRGY